MDTEFTPAYAWIIENGVNLMRDGLLEEVLLRNCDPSGRRSHDDKDYRE